MKDLNEALCPQAACERCGSGLLWEALHDDDQERWLGVCKDCGWMIAFLPDEPQARPKDPLRTFLLGRGPWSASETPPWIRVFRTASKMPWELDWIHSPAPCAGCGTKVTFEVQTFPRPGVIAHCLLCLVCGRATVEHLRPGTFLRETPVVGQRWSPPDVGVARLREAVFQPFWRKYIEPGSPHEM
jgi:hypothetical protein